MRGFDTQGSIFIDGIRDLGTVSRDTFNTEQVEVAKGPAGPDYGRSAASGYVNLASKVPVTSEVSPRAAPATARPSNGRITGDVNHRFEGTGTALRLNVMGQNGEVDGRDFIEREGWAVAPSLAFGLEGPTRAYFYLLHTEQDNTPDGGVPPSAWMVSTTRPSIHPLPPPTPERVMPDPVDSENFYGLASDFEEIKGTMFTARIEHDFSDNRLAAQHLALRQAAPVLCADRRECADASPTRPGRLDRGANAPGEVPGQLAAHQPDQYHGIREHRRYRSRRHRRFRVHQRGAVQPRLRRAGHADSAGKSLQPEPQ